jgi:hypothetical protein
MIIVFRKFVLEYYFRRANPSSALYVGDRRFLEWLCIVGGLAFIVLGAMELLAR